MFYYAQAIGLDERSVMRATNGAFKIGIRFANFNRQRRLLSSVRAALSSAKIRSARSEVASCRSYGMITAC
jgi:hypothetical protein